jgi:hypothetical protein
MPRILKLVPMSIEGVIRRLVQERYGSRPSASIEEWRKILNDLVASERAAILELIESARADAHIYDGDYVLRTVAAAIRARGGAEMGEKEGILRMMASGRWAVYRPGRCDCIPCTSAAARRQPRLETVRLT